MTAQRPPQEGPPSWLVATLILSLFAAPALVTLGAGALALRYTRARPWWLVTGALVALGTTFALEGVREALVAHVWVIEQALLAVRRGQALEPLIVPGILRMVPVGAPVGLLLAAGAHQPAPGLEPTRPNTLRQAELTPRKVERLVLRAGDSDALGVYLGGDLAAWRRGALVVPPPGLFDLGVLVLGQPGVGKSVAAARLAYLMARQDRQLVVIDGKGDRGFVDLVTSAYLAGRPGATVKVWPDAPYDLWRTDPDGPDALVGKLMGVWTFDERSEFYGIVAELVLRLAVGAPGMPPVAGAVDLMERVDLGWLRKAWERHRFELGKLEDTKEKFNGVSVRIANLVATLGGKFDGQWAVDDVDLAILSVPTVANRRVGDASMRILLGEFAHYATVRKPPARRAALLFDEFSALEGGRPLAVDQMERNRGFGVGVVLSAQSVASLGDVDQRERLLSAAAAVIAFRSPIPAQVAQLAGTIHGLDAAHRYDDEGAHSVTYTERQHAKVEPGLIRSLPTGIGAVISGDHALQVKVIQTPAPALEGNAPRRLWLPSPPGWRRKELEP
jgi:hypothetical protein